MGSTCTNMKYVWARICLASVTVGHLGHVGCSRSVDIPIPNCGSVTLIEGTSPDANNDDTIMGFTTSDCSPSVVPGATEGTFVITIDIVADSGGTPKPRVKFTLEVSEEEFPRDEPIRLDRVGLDLETQLPRAFYQEVDPAREAAGDDNIGPFWSSTDGTILFEEQLDGTLRGTFEFDADNPSEVDNDARGEIQVAGTVLVNPILTIKQPCGMQSFSVGMVTLMGLCVVRFGLRRRRGR